MYEERWNCFMKTGRIRDYLEYKQELEKQPTDCYTKDETGEKRDLGYAGFCNCDRNHNEIRTNWRV